MTSPYTANIELSDRQGITITRLYEVNCPVCGVIDATRTTAAALVARRDHRQWHREQKAAKP